MLLNRLRNSKGFRNFLFRRYHLIRFLQRLVRVRNGRKVRRELKARERVSIFDYKQLIRPVPWYPVDVPTDNTRYGLSYSVKRYAGIDVHRPMGALIEHGLYFGSWVGLDTQAVLGSHVFTFGDVREARLKKKGVTKQIAKIGPMILYAPPLYENQAERIAQLKEELGRTLLFFPMHGDRYFNVTVKNLENLVSQIKAQGAFDTYLVSLYYHDILNGELASAYERLGFRVVTSGHKFDPLFLSRQAFLIQLADSTASNGAGTHVGYCVAWGKEHWMVQSEVNSQYANKQAEQTLTNVRTTEDNRTFEEESLEVERTFLHGPQGITENHKRVVAKYWGTAYHRTPEQMRELILSTSLRG